MRASHLAALGKGNVYSSMAGLELLKLFVRLFIFNSSNQALTTLLSAPTGSMPAADCCRNPDWVVEAFKSLSESKQALLTPMWPLPNDSNELLTGNGVRSKVVNTL